MPGQLEYSQIAGLQSPTGSISAASLQSGSPTLGEDVGPSRLFHFPKGKNLLTRPFLTVIVLKEKIISGRNPHRQGRDSASPFQ